MERKICHSLEEKENPCFVVVIEPFTQLHNVMGNQGERATKLMRRESTCSLIHKINQKSHLGDRPDPCKCLLTIEEIGI